MTVDDDDRADYEDNIHYNAFRFCLNARRNGWPLEEMEQALRNQWAATEPLAHLSAPPAPAQEDVTG